MPDTSTISVRPLTREQAPELLDVEQWAFVASENEGDLDQDTLLSCLEWDRTFGAYLSEGDGESLTGVCSAYSLDLPVPGGSAPCGGLTWVGVHPGSRRRGALSAMIPRHLDDVRTRREPVSALHASETTIYGRFGYGAASRHAHLTLPRRAELIDVPGAGDIRLRVEKADVDRHAELIGDCYDAQRTGRPGMASRFGAHRRRLLYDPTAWREGAESLRIVIAPADDQGPVRGYALFRRKGHWAGPVPGGRVQVSELVARDPAAARALWGFLLDLDLMGTIEVDPRPVDDSLFHLLRDPRAGRPELHDGLWVRLVDLPAALAARHYSGDLDVVVEVTDRLLEENSGRWRFQVDGGAMTCARTDAEAALALDVRELGSAYLGSVTLGSLAGAGLVTVHDAEALRTASAAFAWPVAAYCGWVF